MDFGLSEEQELLQETLRDFVARECPPARVRERFEADGAHDPALWSAMAEVGLCGLCLPEDCGGAQLELLDLALAAEVLGEGGVPGPFLGHALAGLALLHAGSEEQRGRWLPRLASGEAIGSVALAEPDSAWEPERWTARLQGGRVGGAKRLVPHAAVADLIVVGLAGGGMALVERSAEGLSVEPFAGVDGTRDLAGLRLDAVPAEALPGGSEAWPRLRDAGLVLLAADSFGGAWKLIRDTIDYLGTRRQFGTPLVQFQSVKHQLADLATELEPARSLYWYAAHAFDHIPAEAERSAALAKAHITDRALHVAREVLELHGGIGFTWECDVHLWYKRAMWNRAFLGGPDHHRERCARLAGW